MALYLDCCYNILFVIKNIKNKNENTQGVMMIFNLLARIKKRKVGYAKAMVAALNLMGFDFLKMISFFRGIPSYYRDLKKLKLQKGNNSDFTFGLPFPPFI